MLKITPKYKQYRLSKDDIANMFEYSSPNAFRSSTAHKRIMRAIDKLILHIENQIILRMKG